MIVIFSSKDDFTTNKVCDWLRYYQHDYIRLNREFRNVSIEKIDLLNDIIILNIEGVQIDIKDITAVWYRRGGLAYVLNEWNKTILMPKMLKEIEYIISDKIKNEINHLTEYLQLKVENNKSIGSYFNRGLNKLEILDLARKEGFKIPDTFVVSNKDSLKGILSKKEIITKAISDGLYEFTENTAYYTYTEEIKNNNLDNFSQNFSPSLIQTKIQKKIEIRSFFLIDSFYSMAIFSQSNKKTSTDYRKYDAKTPNRMIPYKLPKNIENKLRKIYSKIGLNTGSADIMIDEQNNFYFLEINPVGQFTMTSTPCNYFLEKRVALELIRIKNETTENKKNKIEKE